MAKTEIGRFGNLNGNYNVITDVYGIGIGRYESNRPHMLYDSSTGKLSFKIYETEYMSFEYNSGNPRVFLGNSINSVELVTSGLNVGNTGKISGGDVIYGLGNGFWMGYNAGAYKVYIGNNNNALTYDGTDLSLTGAFKGGKTGFSDNTDGFWMGKDSGVYKVNIGNASEYMKWDETGLSITGGLTVDSVDIGTSGVLKGGQTDYDTGVGFWLGYTGGQYKMSFGNSAGKKLLWDGTNLTWTTQKSTAEVDGTFKAVDAIISGTLTANSGRIGGASGWLIETGKMTSTGIGLATSAGDATYAFWAGDNTPANAEFSVKHDGSLKATSATITGVITANTGYIGGASGWTIAAGKMTSAGIGLATSAGDATYAFWAGDNTPASAEFSVKHDGSFKSTAGTIGGWTIGSADLTAGTGENGVGISTTGGATPAFWAGNTTPANAEFRVYQNGNLVVTNADVSGKITATSGDIGSWNINGNTLVSDNGTINLDAENNVIYVGDIHLHGSLAEIHSNGYVSGISGFKLNADYLEVNNINARGMIRTACFQKDSISVVGGTVMVLPGDVLAADMTANGTTLIASGTHTFELNDVIRIKDGEEDEWLYITNVTSAPTYTVQRDLAGVYDPGANPAWKKGSTIVSYQGWSEGGVKLTSTETNAPYLSVFVRPASTTYPYQNGGLVEKVRLGNLTGIAVTSGYGLWTDNGYFTGTVNAQAGYFGDGSTRVSVENGGLTIGNTGSIRGGATNFSTGTGLWMGYESSAYKLRVGDPSGAYLAWNGSLLTVQGDIQTNSSGQRVFIDQSENTLSFYDSSNNRVILIDDDLELLDAPGMAFIEGGGISLGSNVAYHIRARITNSYFDIYDGNRYWLQIHSDYITAQDSTSGRVSSMIASGTFIGSLVDASLVSSSTHGSSSTTLYIGNKTIDTTASDGRYKDILGITVRGLNLINKLQVVDYTWKESFDSKDKKKHIGLVAQDIYDIDESLGRKPENEETGLWAISNDDLLALCVKSIQELNDKIIKLEKENKKLQKELGKLQLRL